MTLFYPDISSHQERINLAGTLTVCAKATEGTTYFNPYYDYAKGEAATHGAYFTAYHFLRHGNISAQANWAHSHVGRVPLMVDLEPAGSSYPTANDALTFIDAYRNSGGVTHLLYFPKWYWSALGYPPLEPFKNRGMLLVSSVYGVGYTDSDTGAGWQPYGGLTPTVWQYTSTHTLNGTKNVDFNAFRGTLVEYKSLVTTGRIAPNPYPTLRLGDSGTAVITLQRRLNIWGADIAVDGYFGPLTDAAVRTFQTQVFGPGPDVDGIVGPATWAELLKDPRQGDNGEDDDMADGFLTPENQKQAIPFPAGKFSRIQFLQDWPDTSDPPVVRVAVRSFARGWSQITEIIIKDAGVRQVVFKENDIHGVSLACPNPGHAIGWFLSKS